MIVKTKLGIKKRHSESGNAECVNGLIHTTKHTVKAAIKDYTITTTSIISCS